MYKANHEILYRDDFGTQKIDPGSVLTKEQEKALAKDLPTLEKSRAVSKIKDAPTAKKAGDGFDAK